MSLLHCSFDFLQHSEEAWQQTMERRKEREETLKRLTLLIRSHYGDTYDARPFGSTCYGASSSTSDIDVVIIVSGRFSEAGLG